MKIHIRKQDAFAGSVTISPHSPSRNPARAAIIDAVDVVKLTAIPGKARVTMGPINHAKPAALRSIAQALLMAAEMLEAYQEFGMFSNLLKATPFPQVTEETGDLTEENGAEGQK